MRRNRIRKGYLTQDMIDCLMYHDKDGKTLEKYHYDKCKVDFCEVLDDIVKNQIKREYEFFKSLVESDLFSSVSYDKKQEKIIAQVTGNSGAVIHIYKTFYGLGNPFIKLNDEDMKLVNDAMGEVDRLREKYQLT